ncbi:MAG TPA: hypothetical protein VGI45_05405 [Terracidiphilus sp.]|jgi:hypothetical protein
MVDVIMPPTNGAGNRFHDVGTDAGSLRRTALTVISFGRER